MNSKSKIVIANIENLTSLWKTVGISFQSYFSESKFDYCFIENSDWPNRLWFHQHVDQIDISIIKEKILSISSSIIIPYFDTSENDLYKKLESEGFIKQFEQVGMSLKLDNPIRVENNLSLQLVSNKSEAIFWSELFEITFGYKIQHSIVLKTSKEINYYIAHSQNQAVGTAVSYKTNKVMGIHSVGIHPEMRRKGYAKQLMEQLINDAIKKRCNYMTLQASDMGKSLYLNLGFNEDFVIKNYSL